MSGEAIDAQPEVTANVQEPIAKAGGESFTSFDELTNVQNFTERKQELKSKDEGGQNGKEKSKEKNKEEVLDKKAQSETTNNKNKIAKEEKQTEPKDEVTPQIKTIKLKNGDQEVSLRHDTKVPVKVDGQILEVPVEDLVKNYSGTKAVEERFKTYSQEKYKFDQERKEVEGFVKDVFEASKSNPIEGLLIAAQRMGLDPVQYRINLMDALAEQAMTWSQMSEQDRALYKYQQENAQLKSQHEKIKSQQMLEKETKELDLKVKEFENKLGVTREDFAKHYHELAKLQKDGKFNKEITPELVADYISDMKKVGQARDILKEIDPSLGTNKDALDSLVEIMYDYPKLGVEDLKGIAKEYYGKVKPAQKITEKLSKGKPDLVEPKRKINAGQDLLSFDELDRLYT